MDYKDYYAVLGAPRTASQTEIKKAFRKLARQYHPDTKPGDAGAERRFKEINEANAVLSDPDKRVLYDRLGADWEAHARAGSSSGAGSRGRGGAAGGPFAASGAGPGGNVRYEFHGAGDAGDFSDFFNTYFAGASEPSGAGGGSARGRRATGGPTFQDILAGMGLDGRAAPAAAAEARNRGAAHAGRARPAPTAEAVAEITLEEAYQGTTRLVEVDGKRLEVSIPAGADTGTRIRLTGKAPGGGDLHVVVRQLPDPTFTRKGADLERELPLTLGEALLGAEVTVRTPKGRVLLTIPAGTQPGRTFRLSGRGMPRFKASTHGDLYVKARVIMPTDLSDAARDAARPFIDLTAQPDPRSNES